MAIQKKQKLILIFLGMLISQAMSQPSVSITSYLVRDDNEYQSRDAYNTLMNHSSLQVGYGWDQQTIRLRGYYSIETNQFNDNSLFNSTAHQFLLKNSFDYRENIIQINGLFKIRKYDDDLNYYNINQYQFSAQIQNSPSLERIGTAGLLIQKDMYPEYRDLDNFTYQLYTQYQYFFQGGLSLSGNASLGVKNYLNQSVHLDYGSDVDPERTVEETVKASQIRGSVKLGKSLTRKMGVSLTLGGQWFVGDPIESYTGGIYYYTENDLYDDPYAYQGSYADVMLTRQFNIGFQVKLGARTQAKDYAGTPALDENAELKGETRWDTRNEYYLTINKKITTTWRIPEAISLFANFIYRQNPSNDPYYDFEDQIGVVGFSVGF